MATAGALRATLGLDTAEYDRGIKQATKLAESELGKLPRIANDVGRAIGTSIAVGFTAISAGIERAIARMDRFATTAQRLDVPTEVLSSLSYAAGQTGTSIEALEGGLLKLGKRLTEAAGGNAEATKMFRALGIAVTDSSGQVRAQGDVLVDVAAAFQRWEAGAADATIASALFGRSAGPSLVPLLREGRDGIEALVDEAERFGLVVSSEAAQAADDFGDNLAKLRGIAEGAFNSIATSLLPTLLQLSDAAVQSSGSSKLAGDGLNAIAEGARFAIVVLATLKNSLEVLVDLSMVVASAGGVVAAAFREVGQDLGGAAAMAKSIAEGDWSTALEVMRDGAERRGAEMANAIAKVSASWAAFKAGLVNYSDDVADAALAAFVPIESLGDVIGKVAASGSGARAPVEAFAGAVDDAGKTADKTASRLRKFVPAAKAFVESIVGTSGRNPYIEFRKNLDALEERIARLDLTPVQADARELGLALQEAFARGTPADIERIVGLIKDFAAGENKAADEAERLKKGLRSVAEIGEDAARSLQASWSRTFDDLGQQIAQFIGSGGEGGIGGLFRGLAETLSGGLSDRLGNALSAGFSILGAKGSGKQALAGFENAGGFEAIGEMAGQALGTAAGGGGEGAQIGAALGTAIGSYFGPWGAAVGGILGGLVGGMFDEDSDPTLTLSSRGNMSRNEGQAYGPLGYIFTDTKDYDTPGQNVANAILSFDRQIADLLEPEQITRASNALRDFFRVYENGSTSLETVLGDRFNIIVRTLDQRIQQFVGTAGTLEERVNRLQEALALMERAEQGLFDNMLGSAVENAFGTMRDRGDDAAKALERIGMAAGTTREQLEEAFNHGQGLSIEQIKLWIEAADSLNELNEATEAYNQAIEQQKLAVQSYNDFINGFRWEALGLSDFQVGLRGLANATRDAVAQANALARAAGLQGAREEDLAYIHEAAAERAARAARELEAASRSLAEQLYGPMDQISASANIAASSLSNAADAIDRARQGLTDFADDLQIGDDSPLGGRDKLGKAMELLLDASSRGDASRVQELASATLGIGRDVFASGRDFNDLFDRVQAIIRGTIPAIDPSGGLGDGAGAFAAGATALSAAQRYELAAQLAQNIADLSDFSGDGFDEVAERLGVNLSRLAADLQIAPDTIDTFLESLKPPPEADSELLPANFGLVVDAVNDTADQVVEAVEESGDEVVGEIAAGNETRDEIRDLQREGNTLFRRMVAILEQQEGRGVRS